MTGKKNSHPAWAGDLKRQMVLTGITQRQIANLLGVSDSHISMILSGRRDLAGAQVLLWRAFYELVDNEEV